MAEETVWKPIETIPRNTLVLVYDVFYGRKLRMKMTDGAWYDDNDDYDDSGIPWDLWTDIPPEPGPANATP